MSWPDMMSAWAPAPADPLRLTILAALATAALQCRDPGLAERYTDAYTQVATGGTAWCDLAVKLISEQNL